VFQLNFYPHLDIHHTAFRAVCIGIHRTTLPLDAYRLLDFFLTFPFEVGIIRLRGSKLKRLAEAFEAARPYRWTSEPAYTFLQMIEFQTAAVRALAQQAVVDRIALGSDRFQLSSGFEPQAGLRKAIEEFVSARGDIISAVLEIIEDHGVTGDNGLKARSGLMPHKYDVSDDAILN
jgi:hypothetical protein